VATRVQQQGKATSVWGTADTGSEVTVSIYDQVASAKADDNGHWSGELKPLKTSMDPITLTVKCGDDTIEVKNILVGEVWMCSG